MRISTPGSAVEPTTAQPEKAPPKAAPPTPVATFEGAIGRGMYTVKVFKWSDGKFGGTVEAGFPFEDGKTKEQTASEANNYACEMLRDLNETLARAFTR